MRSLIGCFGSVIEITVTVRLGYCNNRNLTVFSSVNRQLTEASEVGLMEPKPKRNFRFRLNQRFVAFVRVFKRKSIKTTVSHDHVYSRDCYGSTVEYEVYLHLSYCRTIGDDVIIYVSNPLTI